MMTMMNDEDDGDDADDDDNDDDNLNLSLIASSNDISDSPGTSQPFSVTTITGGDPSRVYLLNESYSCYIAVIVIVKLTYVCQKER